INFLLQLPDDALHIATTYVKGNGDPPPGIFALYLIRSKLKLNLRQLLQWNLITPWGRDKDVPYILNGLPMRRIEPDHEIVSAFAFKDKSGGLAGKSSIDHVVNIRDVQAIPGHLIAVDLHHNLGQ